MIITAAGPIKNSAILTIDFPRPFDELEEGVGEDVGEPDWTGEDDPELEPLVATLDVELEPFEDVLWDGDVGVGVGDELELEFVMDEGDVESELEGSVFVD